MASQVGAERRITKSVQLRIGHFNPGEFPFVKTYPALAKTEAMEVGFRGLDPAGALSRHGDPWGEAARKAGRGGLVPRRQAPGLSNGTDVGLGAAGLLERMTHLVLGGGGQPRAVVPLV